MKTLFVLFISILLLSPMPALGASSSAGQQQGAPIVSGSFSVSSVQDDGTAQYTLRYAYPQRATVGTNLTVAATLEVSRLTGLLIYFRHYRVDVSVFLGGKLAARAQNVSDPLSAPLFQGGHWGPQNLVMSVSENSFGIRPGETLPANISLSFVGDVYHDFPVSNYTPESGSRTIGSVSIVDPPAVGGEPNTSTFLVLLAIATALTVVAVIAILYLRKRH
jgi:hypothetical protein